MTMPETFATFQVAEMTVAYQRDAGRVGLLLYPTALAGQLAIRRENLRGQPEIDALPDAPPAAFAIDPLAHLKIVGDPYPGAFAQGRTMRGGPSVARFVFHGQKVDHQGEQTTVVTTLRSADGSEIEHRLSWHDGDTAAEIVTVFRNGSVRPVTLEMLTSFSLGGITPFDVADAPERLRVHRFRSVWSAEGRLDTQSIEHPI